MTVETRLTEDQRRPSPSRDPQGSASLRSLVDAVGAIRNAIGALAALRGAVAQVPSPDAGSAALRESPLTAPKPPLQRTPVARERREALTRAPAPPGAPPESRPSAPRRLRSSARLLEHRDVIVNSGSLLATAGVTALLGLAYWALAARLFEPSSVGIGVAAISAMTLLGTIGMVGLGILLIGEMGRSGGGGALVTATLAISGATSALLGLIFALAAPLLSDAFPYVQEPDGLLVFVLGTGLTGASFVLDQALIGVLRGGQQLARNTIFAVTKLVLLFPAAALFHEATGVGLVASWVGGIAFSMVALALILVLTGTRVIHPPDWALLRSLRGAALGHNWLDLAFQAPRLVLPIAVLFVLSAELNASFFVAWTLATFAYIVPIHMCTVLFAVGAMRPEAQRAKIRFTLRASWLFGIVAVPALIILADPLLSLFGATYADQGTVPLQLLALGYIPTIVKVHYIAIGRLRGQLVGTALIVTFGALLEIGAAVGGATRGGLNGLCVGILLAMVVQAVAMLPTVEAFRRGLPMSSGSRRMDPVEPPRAGWSDPLPVGLGGRLSATGLVRERPTRRPDPSAPSPAAPPAGAPPTAVSDAALPWMTARELVGAASCLGALAAVAGGLPGPMRLTLLILFALAGPGVIAAAHVGRVLGSAGTTVVCAAVGVGSLMLLSEASLWLEAWHPREVLGVTAIATLGAIVWECVRRHEPDGPRGAYFGGRAARSRPGVDPSRLVCHLLLIGGGLLLWGVAVRRIDVAEIGRYGMLDALPPTYYGGLLLLVVGSAWALCGRWFSPVVVGAYVVSIIACLFATYPIVYDTARYAWTYKHVGVVRYFLEAGTIDRNIDIYQNWPGFFSLSAVMSAGSGMDPLTYAAWAEVFFGILAVAAVAFAVSGIDRDPRRVAAATVLFVLCNWVGQNYFAPQALAFPLTLVCVGIALRTMPQRALFRRSAGPSGASGASRPTLPVRTAALVALPIVLAVATSHQLSPIFLILWLGVLALLMAHQLWGVLAVLVGIEALWVAMALPFLKGHYALLAFNGVPEARPPAEAQALPGLEWTVLTSRGVALVLGLLAVVGVVRRRRAGLPVLIPAALALAPSSFLLLQSYGAEGGLRAYLFALPWLAILAASAFLAPAAAPVNAPSRSGARGRASRRTAWLVVPATLALGAGTVVANSGLELSTHIPSSDVAAVVWFENNAPPRSVLTHLGPNIPERPTAHYVRFGDAAGITEDVQLTDPPERRRALGSPSLRATTIRGFLDDFEDASQVYFMLGPSQIRTIRLYGILSDETVAGIRTYLRQSPDFKPVFRQGETTVWRYRPELLRRFPLDP